MAVTIYLSERAARFVQAQQMGWPTTPEAAVAIENASDQQYRDAEAAEKARREAIAATRGDDFVIVCLKCKGSSVYVENSISHSDCSGWWGEVSLVCADCGHSRDIVSL